MTNDEGGKGKKNDGRMTRHSSRRKKEKKKKTSTLHPPSTLLVLQTQLHATNRHVIAWHIPRVCVWTTTVVNINGISSLNYPPAKVVRVGCWVCFVSKKILQNNIPKPESVTPHELTFWVNCSAV